MRKPAGVGCLANLISTLYTALGGRVREESPVVRQKGKLFWVRGFNKARNLVDPASSDTLVSKIKPCMSKYKPLYGETANGSLYQL